MGNFSSCTAGFDPVSSPPALTPPHIARVLLVDGSMLKFKAPIKVINLLLDYPNHLICPLDSLAPGLHSLSSLSPDEKLQLGRLYLLLPFKTNMQDSCIKSKLQGMQQKGDAKKAFVDTQKMADRTRLLPGDQNPDVGLANCAKFYKKGDVGLHGEFSTLQSSSVVQQGEPGCKRKPGKCSTAGMVKSEVGLQECAGITKDGDVGAYSSRRRAATAGSSYGKLGERRRRARREMQSKSMDAKEGQYNGSKPAGDKSDGVSPLCDTPELQRAYRSFLLRRSCSWTPRLQPILERR